MVSKRKNEKTEPKRYLVACSDAIGLACGTAKSVSEMSTESLEGARKVVRARPLVTAVLSLVSGAIIGGLLMR